MHTCARQILPLACPVASESGVFGKGFDMRIGLPLLLALMLIDVSGVQAKGFIVMAIDLPYDPKKASCDVVIAHTNTNRATKATTASLYRTGMWYGKRCFKPDPFRAYELYKEIGFSTFMGQIVQDLLFRSGRGDLDARSALIKLKRAGYIKRITR